MPRDSDDRYRTTTVEGLSADRFYLIAPDYPGFGRSDAPPPSAFHYTFDHLAQIVDGFLQQQQIPRYSLYLQDYGGPIGFRLALAHPDRVRALIIQNAVASANREGPEAGAREFPES